MTAWRRGVARLVSRGITEAMAFLFPSRCFACSRALGRHQFMGACPSCWAALSARPRSWCVRCALPLPDDADATGPALGHCLQCAMRALPFDGAVAAVVYGAHARRFLLRAKNGHRRELLEPLAAQLASAVAASGFIEAVDAIVPVPSSTWARWSRGFSPALEIARVLARSHGLPIIDDVLRSRRRPGPATKTLGARGRWEGAGKNIFQRRAIPGLRVLLVDDVLTTGATATACAGELRAAGATEIRVAVWARTPRNGGGFGLVRKQSLY